METLRILLKVENAFHILAVLIVAQAVIERGDLEKAVTQAIALSSFGRAMPTDIVDEHIGGKSKKKNDDA